jgi:D-glycero-D-manno-heptose 1,7-bisphosphate phosphatase
MALKRAVFIDKDGTLIPDIPYNVDPHLITLSPGAGETLRELKRWGYLVVVVSNQSGVARGLFPEAALIPVRERIAALLREFNVLLDGFYYCPHVSDAPLPAYRRDCACRKPQPGMLLRAARDLEIDLSRSWMVGDITTDSEAGNRAGCRTILIEKAYDPIIDLNDQNRPGFIVSSWRAAGDLMLSEGDDDEHSGDSRTLRGGEHPRDRGFDAGRVFERHHRTH